MRSKIRLGSVLLVGFSLLAACGGAGGGIDPAGPVVVTFETPDGETFKAVVSGEEAVTRVTEALKGDGDAGIPNGELVAGDGGINAPHGWHLENVEMADATMELCDGTVSLVNDDLEYWLSSVGRFCPWDARVIAVEPAD